jgi:probable HAF family extracellular repeat protein
MGLAGIASPAYARYEGFIYSNGAYTTLMVPGAFNTYLTGINNAGQVVGYYESSTTGNTYSFIYSGGTYTVLSFGIPPYVGINNLGQVIGGEDNDIAIYSDGVYTPLNIPIPPQSSTLPMGINDALQIVGLSATTIGDASFLYSDGTYTTLNVPQALDSRAEDINDLGQIVGEVEGGPNYHGYLYSNATYSFLDFYANGINDEGTIVGTTLGGTGVIYSGGVDTMFDIIPSTYTDPHGINDTGQIVGDYWVPEPPTWAMLLVGFAGLGFVGYRRAIEPRAA